MALFKEMRFPLEVSAWMVGGPEWKTNIVSTDSGAESRASVWQYPLHKWDCGAGLRLVANAEATKRFQFLVRGRAYGFRVQDPFDFVADVGQGALIATATANVYQLVKLYAAGGDVFQRIITKPVPGSGLVVMNASADVTAGLDYTSGLATITGVSNVSTLSWSGPFDVPVRFENDWLQIGIDSGGLLNWTGVSLVELRVAGTSSGTPPPLS